MVIVVKATGTEAAGTGTDGRTVTMTVAVVVDWIVVTSPPAIGREVKVPSEPPTVIPTGTDTDDKMG